LNPWNSLDHSDCNQGKVYFCHPVLTGYARLELLG
jgi:hypothetical protein